MHILFYSIYLDERKNLIKKTAISLLLLITFIFSNIFPFSASSLTNSEVIIYSTECPDEVMSYALSSFERFSSSYVFDNGIKNCNTVSIANPFTIENSNTSGDTVFFFPIFNDDTIIATFQIYEDTVQSERNGKTTYTGIMTADLSSALNTILSTKGEKAYLLSFDENRNLSFSTISKATQARNIDKTPMSITTKIETANIRTIEEAVTLRSNVPNYGFVNIDFTDVQSPYTNWCAAHATAAIIRSMKGTSTPKAETLMAYAYPNGYEDWDSFSYSNAVAAGERYGYSPSLVYYKLSHSTVVNEIMSGRPIYIGMSYYEEYDGYTYRYGHACVLRGFVTVTNTYTVWDPYDTSYSTIDSSACELYISQAGETYTWDRTIYGW